MEHYRKTSSKYIEDAPAFNEMRVVSSTKQHDFMTKAVEIVNANLGVGVVISGSGDDCSKVIALIEQLKRKTMPSLLQSTTIKYSRIEDLWEAEMEGLDNLKVVRRIPVLNVILKASETVSLKSNEVANRRRGSGRQTQSHSSKLKPRPHHAHSNKSHDSKTRNPSK